MKIIIVSMKIGGLQPPLKVSYQCSLAGDRSHGQKWYHMWLLFGHHCLLLMRVNSWGHDTSSPRSLGYQGCDGHTGAIRMTFAPCFFTFAKTLPIRFQGGLALPFRCLQSWRKASVSSFRGSGLQLKKQGS